MRLNWGCGPHQPDGWTNSDLLDWGQEHVGDITAGLPFDDGQFDYTVANHVLQMIKWEDLVPVLTELRRVTLGWVRVIVPDLEAATFAYHRNDADHFQISDDHEHSLDGKYCMYVSQAGSTKSVFTKNWVMELCHRANFGVVHKASFSQTITDYLEITSLDSRPEESLFIEARR